MMEKILKDYLKNLEDIENPLILECLKSIKEENVIFRYNNQNTSFNLIEFYEEKKRIQEELQNYNFVNDYKNVIFHLEKIKNNKQIQIVRVFTEKKMFTIYHLVETGKVVHISKNENFNIKIEEEIINKNREKGHTSDFLKFKKGKLLKYNGITKSILNSVMG